LKIGFMGLGTMGLPMCLRLADAGFEILAYDTDARARSRTLGRSRVIPIESLAALGEVDVVLTMLPDGDVVREVLADAVIAAGLGPGTTVIESSSSDPATTAATAHELARYGVQLIDAPVSGSPVEARRGELTLIVGGDDGPVDRVRPILEALGLVHWVGPLGAGHALKALNNLLASINLAAASEVMLIGRRYGLDPEVMLGALNACTGRNDATEHKVGRFVLSRRFDSGFRLLLMRKDIGNALALARSTSAPFDFGALCLRMWDQALEELGPAADNVEVVRWMELAAGATLESIGAEATE
jgi:3-hydroxyisobutyrate dehydrogenase